MGDFGPPAESGPPARCPVTGLPYCEPPPNLVRFVKPEQVGKVLFIRAVEKVTKVPGKKLRRVLIATVNGINLSKPNQEDTRYLGYRQVHCMRRQLNRRTGVWEVLLKVPEEFDMLFHFYQDEWNFPLDRPEDELRRPANFFKIMQTMHGLLYKDRPMAQFDQVVSDENLFAQTNYEKNESYVKPKDREPGSPVPWAPGGEDSAFAPPPASPSASARSPKPESPYTASPISRPGTNGASLGAPAPPSAFHSAAPANTATPIAGALEPAFPQSPQRTAESAMGMSGTNNWGDQNSLAASKSALNPKQAEEQARDEWNAHLEEENVQLQLQVRNLTAENERLNAELARVLGELEKEKNDKAHLRGLERTPVPASPAKPRAASPAPRVAAGRPALLMSPQDDEREQGYPSSRGPSVSSIRPTGIGAATRSAAVPSASPPRRASPAPAAPPSLLQSTAGPHPTAGTPALHDRLRELQTRAALRSVSQPSSVPPAYRSGYGSDRREPVRREPSTAAATATARPGDYDRGYAAGLDAARREQPQRASAPAPVAAVPRPDPPRTAYLRPERVTAAPPAVREEPYPPSGLPSTPTFRDNVPRTAELPVPTAAHEPAPAHDRGPVDVYAYTSPTRQRSVDMNRPRGMSKSDCQTRGDETPASVPGSVPSSAPREPGLTKAYLRSATAGTRTPRTPVGGSTLLRDIATITPGEADILEKNLGLRSTGDMPYATAADLTNALPFPAVRRILAGAGYAPGSAPTDPLVPLQPRAASSASPATPSPAAPSPADVKPGSTGRARKSPGGDILTENSNLRSMVAYLKTQISYLDALGINQKNPDGSPKPAAAERSQQ
eukprot:TRINITY_DN27949_c0_g1_i1.p1 TRINITY_DN27949_c0_g1~~TRINITY_DN27949_c0_g1_i1.p1  ORF type:complete len:842 (+),score=208.41 TRINITY_DN27949_c0_g1_i1:52-2577(+)